MAKTPIKKAPVAKTKKSLAEVITQTISGQGKTLSQQDPETGVIPYPVFSKDAGNLPGIIKHWYVEIEQRKKEISEVTGSKFISRALRLVGKKENPRINGEELMKYNLTTKNVQRLNVLLNILAKNPMDPVARVNLASIIAEKDRIWKKGDHVISSEVHRLALIHATVACSFGEYDIKPLYTTLTVQYNYCEQLQLKCREDITRLETFRDSRKENAEFVAKIDMLIRQLRRNLSIIQAFQSQNNPLHQKHLLESDAMLNIMEIREFIDKTEKTAADKDIQKNYFRKGIQIVSIMRNMPLLHKNAHELSDYLIKMDQNHPMPYFLKARIEKSALMSANSRFEAGDQRREVTQIIETKFKTAYNFYGQARKLVGDAPKGKSESTILYEYAELPYLFYQIAPNLKINLPLAWVKTVFQSSHKVLMFVASQTPDYPGLTTLQAKINMALEET